MIGGPVILQSDNGSEFNSHVITERKEVWANLEMVLGKLRHPKVRGRLSDYTLLLKIIIYFWLGWQIMTHRTGLRVTRSMDVVSNFF